MRDSTGEQTLEMSGVAESLMTGEDVSKLEDVREKLYQYVTELKARTTPKEKIKKREDGYEYATFEHMLEEMDRFHPLRTETVTINPYFDARVIAATAIVTDLVSRESRTGVDAHRITFKKGAQPILQNVIDLGNDFKAARTEALRNAYAAFGVCADLYRRQAVEPPTKEQTFTFEQLTRAWKEKFGEDKPSHNPAAIEYWTKVEDAWKTQTKNSADDFIESLIRKTKKSLGPSSQEEE